MSVYSNFVVDLTNPNTSWSIIARLIADDSTVLDVGCSSGYFDQVLIDTKNCTVDGVELDSADALKAQKICRNVLVGNVEDSSFNLESLGSAYDYILFIDVLEHLLDPSAALDRVSKLLKPTGKIIFSIPNMGNGSVRLQLLQGNFDYENDGLLDRTHLHYYTHATVDEMVGRSAMYWSDIHYTTFDTPKYITDKILKDVGLANTKAFQSFINAGDSLIYQFIGTLSKDKPAKKFSLAKKTAAIKPLQYYNQTLQSVQSESRKTFDNMIKISEEDSRKAEYIKMLEAKVVELDSKLEKSSGSFRAKKVLGKIKHKLKGR